MKNSARNISSESEIAVSTESTLHLKRTKAERNPETETERETESAKVIEVRNSSLFSSPPPLLLSPCLFPALALSFLSHFIFPTILLLTISVPLFLISSLFLPLSFLPVSPSSFPSSLLLSLCFYLHCVNTYCLFVGADERDRSRGSSSSRSEHPDSSVRSERSQRDGWSERISRGSRRDEPQSPRNRPRGQ